ncbi:MAG: MarR family transcriptional regulator [Myxococcota bacterium]
MTDQKSRAGIEDRKAQSTVQVLFKTSRLLNDHALARWRRQSGLNLRASHTALFPHIAFEGSRLTEVAHALGISKQAVAQLVDELVEMGVLERKADPTDGRAKRIVFARGGDGILEGLSLLGEVEDEMRGWLGVRATQQLHETLTRLLKHLETERLP